MGDERHANLEYAEDVDEMILEHLIYSAAEACIDDFMTRRESDAMTQPSQSVLTQLNILSGFLEIYKAKYSEKELDEQIHLWLELLELVALISCRRESTFPLFTTANIEKGRSTEAKLAKRRHYWLAARDNMSKVTAKEHSIYSVWKGFRNKPSLKVRDKLPNPAATLSNISSLFFVLSARMAAFINQSISEQWVELAAQFMLQTVLESYLTIDGIPESDDTLAHGFAWGWIPTEFWDDYRSDDETGMKAEIVINKLFEDASGGEARIWRETRLKYMSLLSVSRSTERLGQADQAIRLQKIAKEYGIHDFEKKVMVFCKGMLSIIPKPLLVQIEQGGVDGMTKGEFEDFKKKAFLPL